MDQLQISNPTAAKRYTEMKMAMLLNVPFFASLALDMMQCHVGKFPDKGPTAATDGKNVWFDEDFLAKLTVAEAVFVYCHEIGHAMFLHMARMKKYADTGFDGEEFNAFAYNVAGDFVINAMLQESQIGTAPKGLLFDRKYDSKWLVDDVYRDIMKRAKSNGGKGDGKFSMEQVRSQGNGQGNDPSDAHGGFDQHIPMGSNVPEAEMRRAIQSAADRAKAMGKLPGSLERFVNDFVNPQVSWRQLLRNAVISCSSRETTTWRSPHRRRLVTQNVYFPTYTGHGAGTIVFAVDTSGSMGQKEFDAGMSELADILTTCSPERIIVLSCDAAVHTAKELESGHDVLLDPPKMVGGGGTSFVPVFEWIRKEGVDPDVLIYFTDMYGTFPSRAPAFRVIWVSTTDVEAPFGQTIRVDLTGE